MSYRDPAVRMPVVDLARLVGDSVIGELANPLALDPVAPWSAFLLPAG